MRIVAGSSVHGTAIAALPGATSPAARPRPHLPPQPRTQQGQRDGGGEEARAKGTVTSARPIKV